MTFRENLNRICKQKGTNLTTVVKELGVSTSKVTAINKGSIPSEDMLLSFARHLECSVMDFFADEEDLLRIYRGLSRRAKHEFMSLAYEFENREELEGDKGTSAAV